MTDKPAGIPIKRKKFLKKDYSVRGMNTTLKTYRGKELEQNIKSINKAQIMAPGNVETCTVMRICDANGRRVISPEIFMELMEVEDIDFADRITIVPQGTIEHITGIDPPKVIPVPEERPVNVMGFPYTCACGQIFMTEEDYRYHNHSGNIRRDEIVQKDEKEES